MTVDRHPPIGTTAKTFEILKALNSAGPIGVTQLAEEVSMSKSTVHHHLQTMEHYGFVVNEEGTYRIGLRLLDYGIQARSKMQIFEIARPELQDLAERTDELTHLLVPEHGRGVLLYRSKGDQAIRAITHAGERVYLHQTALGKAVLAHLPDEQVEEIIDVHGLPASTDNTITSRERLHDELDEVRENGYALDKAEWNDRLWCVAAPILEDDRAIGAISVSAPPDRVQDGGLNEELVDAITSTANVIEIKGSYH